MKLVFWGMFLAVGVVVGAGGVWFWNENQKPKTHEKFCQRMAQDYLASIKNRLKVNDYEWEWGIKNETKMFNLCEENLDKVDLSRYEIENLKVRAGKKSHITINENVFSFESEGKKVTGVINFPDGCNAENKCPVIVQFRGYIDRESYKPGDGTRHSAEMFVKNGFISIAPDFLGYGGSDPPSGEVFEERFEKYTTGLDLLASLGTLPMANTEKIGIWGHSNGGQVTLTLLAAGMNYPAVLWAPVSARFPYSILFYTEDTPDGGKALRKEVARLDEYFDSDKFWYGNYLENITAPVQLHQGTGDTSVPVGWNRGLIKKLKEVEYFEYSGADHNLVPDWNLVMDRSIAFFKNKLM